MPDNRDQAPAKVVNPERRKPTNVPAGLTPAQLRQQAKKPPKMGPMPAKQR